jgi:hypothetical protein
LPCCTSCKITVAVKVLVMLPIGNASVRVSGAPSAAFATPLALTQQPCPGTITATATPGIWYVCRMTVTTFRSLRMTPGRNEVPHAVRAGDGRAAAELHPATSQAVG